MKKIICNILFLYNFEALHTAKQIYKHQLHYPTQFKVETSLKFMLHFVHQIYGAKAERLLVCCFVIALGLYQCLFTGVAAGSSSLISSAFKISAFAT